MEANIGTLGAQASNQMKSNRIWLVSGTVFAALGLTGTGCLAPCDSPKTAPSGECYDFSPGGAILMPNCQDWLKQPLAETCDGEAVGAGGAPDVVTPKPLSALQRVCQSGNTPTNNDRLNHCLTSLVDSDPCASDEKVRDCLMGIPHCGSNLDALGCTPFFAACSELTEGTCFWGLLEPANRNAVAPIEDCFEHPRDEESCVDRFLRCAWDL
jgi:hypothetical protein